MIIIYPKLISVTGSGNLIEYVADENLSGVSLFDQGVGDCKVPPVAYHYEDEL